MQTKLQVLRTCRGCFWHTLPGVRHRGGGVLMPPRFSCHLANQSPFVVLNFLTYKCRSSLRGTFPKWAQENTGDVSRCGFPTAMFGQGYFLFWSPPCASAHWSFEKSCSKGTVLVCLKQHVPNSHKHRKPFFMGWSLVVLNDHSRNSSTDSTAGREELGYLPGAPYHGVLSQCQCCSALHTFNAHCLKRRHWV